MAWISEIKNMSWLMGDGLVSSQKSESYMAFDLAAK